MTYGEVRTRWLLLAALRQVRLGAKALTETLVMHAAYTRAMTELEDARRNIRTGAPKIEEGAEPTVEQRKELDSRDQALAELDKEECGMADRRFTAQGFEGVAEAVMAHGQTPGGLLVRNADGSMADLQDWIVFAFTHLGPTE